MSTDHAQPTEVDETGTPGISTTAEFLLVMVITGAIAFGGVAFLVI